jgi:hypothetical protein
MKKLLISGVLATVLLLQAVGPASAAGGGGKSYCSNAAGPDGVLVVDDLATYSNPGELISALAPLPGNPGSGWNVQGICNPHRFRPDGR